MNLRSLLLSPAIPEDFNESDTYRCACIGAVTLLQEAKAWDALYETIVLTPSEDVRSRVLRILTDSASSSPEAAHILNLLAVVHNNRETIEILKKKDFPDTNSGLNSAKLLIIHDKRALTAADPELRNLTEFFISSAPAVRKNLFDASLNYLPHWHHIVSFVESQTEEKYEAIINDYAHYTSQEKNLLAAIFPNDSLAADLLLRYDDPFLSDFCRKQGLRPADPQNNALFFFLSGQWELYEETDSDYRFIRIAYEKGDISLQRRLLDISKRTGHTDWLIRISTGQSGLNGAQMQCSDYQNLIHTLIQNGDNEQLWKLLPTVPVLNMRQICDHFAETGFNPSDGKEREFLNTLTDRLRRIPESIPLPVLLNTCEENSAVLGTAVSDQWAAAAFSNRSISVRKGDALKDDPLRIQSENHLFRNLCLDPADQYLLSDTGDGNISVFALPGTKSIHTVATGLFPMAGIFVRSDRRKMLAADTKGVIKLFSYPGGTPSGMTTLRCGDCFRCAYDAESDLFIGISLKGILSIFDLKQEKEIAALSLGGPFNAVSEIVESSLLAYIDTNNMYNCLHLLSGKHTAKAVPLDENDRILRLQDVIPNEFTVVGTQKGTVSVYGTKDGKCISHPGFSMGGAVRGLSFSPDKSKLYIASASGRFRVLDFSLFNALTRVYELEDLPGLNRLADYESRFRSPEVSAAAAPLKTVIQWRKRFDIEVSYDFE